MLALQPNDNYSDAASRNLRMHFQAFSRFSHDAIVIADDSGAIIFWNQGAENIFGYTVEEMVGHSVAFLLLDARRAGVARAMADGYSVPSDEIFERIGQHKDGREFPIEFSLTTITTENGHYYYSIIRDITLRKQTEHDARQSEERYHMVVSNAPIILFALDTSSVITLVEGQGLQVLGLKPEEIVGRSVFESYSAYFDLFHRALVGESFSVTIQIQTFSFDVHLTPLRDGLGTVTGVIGVATDVTQRTQAEEKLRHQTLYDSLTGLPNRFLLQKQLEQVLVERKQSQCGGALLLLGLKRFKEINDTFGHQHGDQLLQQVAERLLEKVQYADAIAHLAGDSFAVLLSTADKPAALAIAQRLQRNFKEPFTLMDLPLHVETSIGIALAPEHGTDAATLIRHADIAMYIAKTTYEGYTFYDTKEDYYSPQRLQLIGDLRHAIVNQELQLYYQPKAELQTRDVHSVEALVRWHHPTYGFVPPDQFIPLAEQTGLIASLTDWVLQTAIRQCKEWYQQGLDLKVAINLSIWNLRDSMLPDRIASLLTQYELPACMIRVEITESTLMTERDVALDVLQRLFEQGICISIDDFGTGYSSLAYLKHLPVDELKIDRSFVQYLATIEVDIAIVRSIVAMAHSLGLQVVAEGVEDLATWNLLKLLGCDTAQGYYLSRPVPARHLERWLQEMKQTAA